MDRLTVEQRKKNMQAVKSKGSQLELILNKALWGKGYRFTKNDKRIFGKPDIVFRKLKIAIFVDSEFWHGKNWNKRKLEHKTNIKFWHQKIERNIKRDNEVNAKLKSQNWRVVRVWGNKILADVDGCVKKIEKIINEEKDKQI